MRASLETHSSTDSHSTSQDASVSIVSRRAHPKTARPVSETTPSRDAAARLRMGASLDRYAASLEMLSSEDGHGHLETESSADELAVFPDPRL